MTSLPAGLSPAAAKYAGVRVLVLGASGFIGGRLMETLARAGAGVHAIVRDASRAGTASSRGAVVSVADLTRPGAAATVLSTNAPAITFNLAGYGVDHSERDPAAMTAMNSSLVDDLCAALARHPVEDGWKGLRMVQAGSALEYGPVKGTIDEESEAQPDTDYGRTKLAGTRAVVAAGSSSASLAAVARLFTVYGPGEHTGRLLPSLIAAAKSGSSVSLTSGEQPRDFTFVDEAVEGLLRLGLCPSASGTVLNVATGRLTTVRQFVEQAAEVLGIPPERLRFGAVTQQKGEMFHGVIDTSRVQQVLGWRPTLSVRDGIRRTWEQERHG